MELPKLALSCNKFYFLSPHEPFPQCSVWSLLALVTAAWKFNIFGAYSSAVLAIQAFPD